MVLIQIETTVLVVVPEVILWVTIWHHNHIASNKIKSWEV